MIESTYFIWRIYSQFKPVQASTTLPAGMHLLQVQSMTGLRIDFLLGEKNEGLLIRIILFELQHIHIYIYIQKCKKSV